VEYVVVVEERVRRVVELASLVVGEALEQALAGVREERHAAEAACGRGDRAEGWDEGERLGVVFHYSDLDETGFVGEDDRLYAVA
jgi:hypothetical protein